MKLRGEQVAVLLADYRMPRMTGIEFLEQAMDLYPAARRVLLTAYADTDAAIDAINVVDLDHYLLKPWDPPEEKLYPVVDALLERVARARTTGRCRETKVVGHRWSARSSEVREFLARNQVALPLVRVRRSPRASGCSHAAGADGLSLPVVITTDGDALVAPSDAELAGRGRPGDHAVKGLLRPHRHRRRAGRARRRGVRRLGGAAHRAGRAHRDRRPGRARARGSRTTSASPTGCPARS